MRTIQTYILRLLLDTEDPHTVRGVIRAVADDEEQPFADDQALLILLHRMSERSLSESGFLTQANDSE
jgi:hypothetical protein